MIVGTGISELIEAPGKALKFDLEEMQSEEALWYLSLTKVHDEIGSPDSIEALKETTIRPRPTRSKPTQKPKAQLSHHQRSKVVAIEEIEDSGEDEDDDLIPYEKPDDDAEDSDDDPTLIQRNKPTAPV